MSNQISIGSKVKTAKGTEGTIAQILDGGYLLDTGKRVRAESIALVVIPPEPVGIQIGDRLRRNSQPQTFYPKAWFPNGIDPRPPMIDAIEAATVEGLSPDGYWVATSEGKTYHVSESLIEGGDWELIERNYQQN